MKEYIKLTGIDMEGYSWCLGFCKDSKLDTMHRGKDKPAHIWSHGKLTYYKDGRIIKYAYSKNGKILESLFDDG